MYYSDAGRLQYSGGDCGQQDHPDIFKNFPKDSDTPLIDSPDSKATENEVVIPIASTPAVHNTTNTVLTLGKETTPVPIPLEISTDSPSHDTSQEFDISDLEYGKEESPKQSPSAKQDKQGSTEPVSQNTSKGMELSISKESQSVIPVTTSIPVIPVSQSQGKEDLHVVPDWPSLTAVETTKLGQVTGVSLDSKGQVVVFHRGSRTWDYKYVTKYISVYQL